MGKFAAALDGFSKLNGIRGAFILEESGKIIEGINPGNLSPEKLAGVAASALSSFRRVGKLLGKGESGQNYIEYGDFNFTVEPFGKKYALIVAAQAGTNLGRIRFEMKRSKPVAESLLAG